MGVKKAVPKINRSDRFLETITFLGNDVLVPIKRIEYIMFRINENGSYEISIKGRGKYEWFEHFGEDEKKANARYEMIKGIVNADK